MKAFTYLAKAMPASTLRRGGLVVLLATMGTATSLPARSDGTAKLTPSPPPFVLGVAPLVAAPGVPRTLTMSGYFPTGCAPVAVRIVPPVVATTRRELGVVLVVPPATPACAQDFALYSLQASYTPEVAGQEEVIAYTDAGALAGRGTIVTAAATLPRARRDVAGAWYDPATSGSGMMIAHDYGGTDQLFVTWQIYDAAGNPRWLTLQQGRWDAEGTTYEGTLYETRSAAPPCPVCAAPVGEVIDRGRGRLAFAPNGANGRLEALFDELPAGGAPRRLGNLVRFLPDRIAVP